MGFDFGALIRGGAKALTGHERGRQEAAEMERKARLQMLQESLLNAQVKKATAPVAPEDEWSLGGDGRMKINRRTGATERVAFEGQPYEPPQKPSQPRYSVHFTDQGLVRVNEDTGEATPIQVGDKALRKPVEPEKADKPKDPTAQEQNARAFLGTQQELSSQLEKMENAGLKLDTGAEIIEGLGNMPIIGGMARPLTGKAANAMRDSDQQRYRSLKGQWMIGTLRLDSQGQISPEEFARYDAEYFQQPNDSPATIKGKQAARRLKEKEAAIRGGNAPPSIAAPQASASSGRSHDKFRSKR